MNRAGSGAGPATKDAERRRDDRFRVRRHPVPRLRSLRTELRGLALAVTLATGGPVVAASPAPDDPTDALAVDPRQEALDAQGLALFHAAEGRLRRSLEILDAVLAAGSLAEVQTDRDRVAAVLRLRGEFLDHWLERSETLEISHGGRDYEGRLVAVDDETLSLAPSRGPEVDLPVDALRPADMAVDLKLHARDLGDPLVRGLAFLLSSEEKHHERARRDLRRLGTEGRELAATSDHYRQMIDRGRPWAILEELAAAGPPADDAAADATLDGVRALVSAAGGGDVVTRRRAPLTRLLRDALTVLADARDEPHMLAIAGTAEDAGDGLVRVAFDFDDTASLERNFRPSLEREAEREGRPRLSSPGTAQARLGSLVLNGPTCLRSVLEFEAPLTVSYELTWGRAPAAAESSFRLGLCDDGDESSIESWGLGKLRVRDEPTRFMQDDELPTRFRSGVRYAVELRHDGRRIASSVDGEAVSSLPCGPRTSGGLVLWTHADRPIVVSRLVVEGRVTAACRAEREQAWIERELEVILSPDPPTRAPGSTTSLASRGKLRHRANADDPPFRDNIDAALTWLAFHQHPGGYWSSSAFDEQCGKQGRDTFCTGRGSVIHDVGVTGLALLAFLGMNHTDADGEHRGTVRDGLRYLLDIQGLDGNFGDPSANLHTYDHLIATLAVIEAWVLTERPEYEQAARNALEYVYALRVPGRKGWRYADWSNPEMLAHPEDTSVTGWVIQVLTLADQYGLGVARRFVDDAYEYIESMTDDQGQTGYWERGGYPARPDEAAALRWPFEHSQSMTAVGVLSRLLIDPELERPGNARAVERGALLIRSMPIEWRDDDDRRKDFYYWYYGTHALVQVGGSGWKTWQRGLHGIAANQVAEGERKGSWDPSLDPWGQVGGRVYSTALLALCLEAPVRYETR